MVRKLGSLIAAAMLAIPFAQGASAQAISMLNRSHEIPLDLSGFRRERKKASTKDWNQNLRRAQSKSKRGGSRPVFRGR